MSTEGIKKAFLQKESLRRKSKVWLNSSNYRETD